MSSFDTEESSRTDSESELEPKSKRKKKEKKKKRKSSSKCEEGSKTSDVTSDFHSADRKRHKKEKKKRKKKEENKKVKRKKKQLFDRADGEEDERKEMTESPVCSTISACSKEGNKRVVGMMTKEEWEKQQKIVRRIVDPQTGRTRLVKGSGEILEEIVSRERHQEINKQATIGDGISFQAQLGVYK